MRKRRKAASVGIVICFVAMIAFVGYTTFSRYERKAVPEEEAEIPAENVNTPQVEAQIPEIVYEEPIVEASPVVETQPTEKGFSVGDILHWPVCGNVILNYSMDNPVHFLTLDQYKYNPALIIDGEIGEEVLAAADGEVKKIEECAETGITITVDLGGGYELRYGQLKDVTVKEGDSVKQDAPIAVLNEPTKYYSVEGCNLYFQMLKDGKPENPLKYLEA